MTYAPIICLFAALALIAFFDPSVPLVAGR